VPSDDDKHEATSDAVSAPAPVSALAPVFAPAAHPDSAQLEAVQTFFEKIDRLIALREPGVMFIYGDQHDLKMFKTKCAAKMVDLAMQVIRISQLERNFRFFREKLEGEVLPKVVEDHYDSLYTTPISLSDIMGKTQQGRAFFSDALLKEAQSLFLGLEECDKQLHTEKLHTLDQVLEHTGKLAIERKTSAVADNIKAMQEKFKEKILANMDALAEGIHGSSLKLQDALRTEDPKYARAWIFFDDFDSKFGVEKVFETKKSLSEREKEMFEHLRREASLAIERRNKLLQDEALSTITEGLALKNLASDQIQNSLVEALTTLRRIKSDRFEKQVALIQEKLASMQNEEVVGRLFFESRDK